MALHHIRLELARCKDAPEGNRDCGYEFVAPLDSNGYLDHRHWARDRRHCQVRRFWAGEKDERGRLLHSGKDRWAFSYAPGDEDDEPAFKFDRHQFAQGEYVSVTEHDGVTRPFKVAAITPQTTTQPADWRYEG